MTHGAHDPHGPMTPALPDSAGGWDLALAVLGACAVVIGGVMLWQAVGWRTLDDDELQHLHFAWCIQRGLVAYRDFWDNHSPLLHDVLRRVVALNGAPSAALFSARRLATILSLPAIPATYLLGRTCFGRAAGWAAAGWAACAPILLMKACEVRPDGLLLSCTAISTWLIALSAKRMVESVVRFSGDAPEDDWVAKVARRDARVTVLMFAAGLVLGVGFVASTKSLIGFVVLMSAWLATAVLSGTARRHERESRSVLRCGVVSAGLGFVIPVGVWWVVEAVRGNASAAMRMTLLDNFAYAQRFSPWPLIAGTNPYALLVAAVIGGAVIITRSGGMGRQSGGDGATGGFGAAAASMNAAGLILLLASVLMCVALGVMPAPYLQSVLPCLPMVAALAGGGTAGLLQWAQRLSSAPTRWVATTGVVAAFAMLAITVPTRQGAALAAHDRDLLAGALITLDDLHALTSESDAVFDGRCAAVFRPHAYFHPALVQGILTRYLRGEIHPSVREQLEISLPACVLRDSRTSCLAKDDWIWIDAHYVSLPAPRDWVMVPGWRIAQAGGAPQSGGLPATVAEVVTAVIVLVPGRYIVVRDDPRTVVQINGKAAGDTIDLERGSATIALLDPVRTVTLARIPVP